MTVLSKLKPYRGSLLAAGAGVAFYLYTLQRKAKNANKNGLSKDEVSVAQEKEQAQKKDRAAVDAVFFQRLYAILKIMFPRFLCSETWYMVVVAVSLCARTYCDVWMIDNGTLIESAIINRSTEMTKKYVFRFVYAMPIIAVLNSLLKYGLSKLKLQFRMRLSNYLYNKYLSGFTYYKMSNLDNRIANPDQLLTQDVERFCECLGELYSNLSKPLLDIIIYVNGLAAAIGASGPAWMMSYLCLTAVVLNQLRRPVGKMTVIEQRLEGEYRYVNSRLITNSEEVAFYQGNRREKKTIDKIFAKLIHHSQNFITFRFQLSIIDNIIAKYIATCVGYLVVSRPFLDMTTPKYIDSTHQERLEDYFKSGRMMIRMSQAVGRVVLAGREMTRLAGFTSRITDLLRVLEDLSAGRYERTMVTSSRSHPNLPTLQSLADSGEEEVRLSPGAGRIIERDHLIQFDSVPLVTPNGDVLIQSLSMEVPSGRNVLVCGPNGCGKSSLFRLLGGLWPSFGGLLTKPHPNKLFYVPQRPYMTLGTLRDQIIYPDTKEDMTQKGITDTHLEAFMDKVQLLNILYREGGWDSVQDWMDVLSGGEKQRVAMARIFYHKPQYAILDECTSAVSVDVEGYIYRHCREVGITLFTVSHRKSLWEHHEYYLHMDGRGAYEYKQIEGSDFQFGS